MDVLDVVWSRLVVDIVCVCMFGSRCGGVWSTVIDLIVRIYYIIHYILLLYHLRNSLCVATTFPVKYVFTYGLL